MKQIKNERVRIKLAFQQKVKFTKKISFRKLSKKFINLLIT